jgi:hypothetical protein
MTHRVFATLATVALLTSVSLCAQGDPIQFQIPFAFHVGDRVMPAGKYSVTPRMSQGAALAIRCFETKAALMILTDAAYTAKPHGAPTLEFTRYGSEYFLERFTDPAYDRGRQLRRSKSELLIAAQVAATKPHLVTIAAR